MMCTEIVQRTAADLPQSATQTLFTVNGGNIQLLGFIGIVTTGIVSDSNTATVYINNVVTISSFGTDSMPVGTMFGRSGGAYSDSYSSGIVAPYGDSFNAGYVLGTNSIITVICNTTSTGQMRWTLWYTPLDLGAYVEVN